MILSILAAHAIPADFECEDITLTGTLPTADVDVPAGFLPALVFQGGCGFSEIEARLREAGDTGPGALVTTESEGLRQVNGQWLMQPDFILQPETDYEMTTTSDVGVSSVFAFSTTDQVAHLTEGLPEATLHDLTVSQNGTQGWQVTAEIGFVPTGTDNTLFIVRRQGLDSAVVVHPAPGAFTSTVSWQVFSDPSGEHCIDVIERDGTGAWHGPSAESCLETSDDDADDVKGCNTAPMHGLWLSLPLLFMARRR